MAAEVAAAVAAARPAPAGGRRRRRAQRRQPLAATTTLLLGLAATTARAALQDEIQVYLDDLTDRGEWGLQLHVNATPSGRTTAEYPGEVVSAGGLRLTAEFARGLGHGLEAGFYLPTAYDGHGGYALAGGKLRLKWIGLEAQTHAGWFAGANFELGHVAARYERATTAVELRTIIGRNTERWTFGFNPILDWGLSRGYGGSPDLNLAFKLARTVATGVQIGGEYYPDFGRRSDHSAFREQDHRVYAAIDVDRKPVQFNAGVGYGLSAGADRWTLKVIITVPF